MSNYSALFIQLNVVVKVAFSAGSSKQGKARRAANAWNCVAARYLKNKVF
jgi:hypothetical protein